MKGAGPLGGASTSETTRPPSEIERTGGFHSEGRKREVDAKTVLWKHPTEAAKRHGPARLTAAEVAFNLSLWWKLEGEMVFESIRSGWKRKESVCEIKTVLKSTKKCQSVHICSGDAQ